MLHNLQYIQVGNFQLTLSIPGAPFNQYKTNLRSFLRLGSGAITSWTPAVLQKYVTEGNISKVSKVLEEHFDDVAKLEFDWLHEMLDIGCNYDEIARLLIDGENASP